MLGSGLALLSSGAAIASFYVDASLIVPLMLLSGLSILLAAWMRGRPVLLLIGYITSLLTFIRQPQGLVAFAAQYDISVELSNILHILAIAAASCLFIAILFFLGCRRQSGGTRLSAQEASEDLDHFVTLIGKVAALLYIPLIGIPIYLLLVQAPIADFPKPDLELASDIALVSWPG